MKLAINMNEWVQVKLSHRGWKVLQEKRGPNTAYKPDENGYYRFQLWTLFEIFGDAMDLGLPSVFEDAEIHFNKWFQ